MRLGLFSSMAALLASSGLAIGQAPEMQIVPAQATQTGPQKATRGLMRQGSHNSPASQVMPVSYTTTMQQPPVVGTGPTTTVMPAPLAPLDVTSAPTVPDVAQAPIYESQMYRTWAKAEYILWRFGSVLLPAFQADVSTGNVTVFQRIQTVTNNVPSANPIDTAYTIPVSVTVDVGLPGGQSADLRDQPGYRLTAGWWIDSAQEWGWEAGFFWLWNRDVGFTNSLNLVGQTVQLDSQFDQSLTVVTTSNNGDSNSTTITSPLFVAADVRTLLVGRAQNQIWGVEANGRKRLAYFGPSSFDLIGGVRFIKIKQEASVFQSITLSPTPGTGQGPPGGNNPPFPDIPDNQLYPSTATLAGTVNTTLFDRIAVKNDYYLAQIGGSFEWDVSERFFVSGYGKLGFGGVRQSASLTGLRTQTVTPPGSVVGVGGNNGDAALTGGLLVAPQDNGTEKTVDRIVFVPEANLNIGWRATPGLSFTVGYNVIHFSNVAKVGNITNPAPIATTVNFGTQRVAEQVVQPGFRFTGDKSNLQGINLGAEFRY